MCRGQIWPFSYYPPFSFIIASEKNGKRFSKIPLEIWVKLAFCLIYGSEIEFLSSCQSKIRQPWCADLGTLKIKFQIYRCWNSNSKNIGSYLIFRVTIYLEMAKLALIWQPWKWDGLKNTKNKISHTTQILLYVVKWKKFSLWQMYLAQWNFISVS